MYLAILCPDFSMDATEDLGVKVTVCRVWGGGDAGLSANLDLCVLWQLERL